MLNNIQSALSHTFGKTSVLVSLGFSVLVIFVRFVIDGADKTWLELDNLFYYGLIPALLGFALIFLHYIKVATLVNKIDELELKNIHLDDEVKHLTIQIKVFIKPLEQALSNSLKVSDKAHVKSLQNRDSDRVMFSRKTTKIKADDTLAMLAFDSNNYSILNSKNISSITDNGLNDISLNYAEGIFEQYFVRVSGDSNIEFNIVEKSSTHSRLMFPNGVKGILRIDVLAIS